MAAKISVATVRKAYRADPDGFSRLYLAKEEQEELSSFRFPQKKFPWLAARVVTKRLYCRLMRGKGKVYYPHEVAIRKISAGPGRGKPLLRVAGLARLTIFSDLSLSHAGPWALCALTNNGQVGIDIEPVEESSPLFTKTVYTSGEIEALNVLFGRMTLPERVKLLWVMKESLLKALGVGFYYGLGSVRLKGAGETGLVFTIDPHIPEILVRYVNMYYGFLKGCVFCITLIRE